MAPLSDEAGIPEPSGSSAPPPPPADWQPTAEPVTPAGEVPSGAATTPPPPVGSTPGAYQQEWPPREPIPAPNQDRERRHDRDGSGVLWIGLVLVVFGVAVLLGQAIPGVSFWMLWPLIIVAAGIIQAVTPGREGWSVNRLFDGLVSVAFGLVLLGNTTGVIGWNVWWRFLWLWPVLLIAAGIGIIGRAVGQRWIGIFGSMLVILALGFAAATTFVGYSPTMSIGSGSQRTLSYSAPVLETTQARLDLNAAAGEVDITSGDDLVSVEARSPWGAPTADVNRSGDSAVVKVAMAEGNETAVYPGTGAKMDLQVSADTIWDVVINSGAVSLEADLEDVPVRSLELKTGVSDSKLTFGPPDLVETSSGGQPVRVKSGVSSVTLRFPQDASVRVRFQTGLSGNDVPDGFMKDGDVWQSPGFSDSGAYWDVTIESGVGSSKIETY